VAAPVPATGAKIPASDVQYCIDHVAKLLSVAVGSVPPAGTDAFTYAVSFTVTPSASNWTKTISSLSIPAFSYGYSITLSPGDNASSLGQVVFVASTATLTTLAGQAWTTTGGTITTGIRINAHITGA
jgi:hypothetical protein